MYQNAGRLSRFWWLDHRIARLPQGHRRDALEAAFQVFLRESFADRILVFDSACTAPSTIPGTGHEPAAGLTVTLLTTLLGPLVIPAGTARAAEVEAPAARGAVYA
jgi:hypothetical protein